MKRNDTVIELGVASKETKGQNGLIPDEQNGQNQAGIARD